MLDTDTMSYIIREQPGGAKARMRALLPSALCVSVITRAELFYGLKRLPANHRLNYAVRELLKIIQPLPWDVEG